MKVTTSSTPQDCPKQSQNVAKTIFGKSYFEVFRHPYVDSWGVEDVVLYSARIIRFFNISNVRNGLVKFSGDNLFFFADSPTSRQTTQFFRTQDSTKDSMMVIFTTQKCLKSAWKYLACYDPDSQ